MSQRVWLIGGTQESAELARSLTALQLACIVTATTETALSLYATTPSLTVWIGRLSAAQLADFIHAHQIVAILDASHPFAVEISQLAIATAAQFDLPYLRYERPLLNRLTDEAQQQTDPETSAPHASAVTYSSFQALLASELLLNKRVLLTIGYRSLPLFQSWQQQATLFVRILPSQVALAAAIAAGFTPDRIVALRPPIPAELERALWRHWQISTVVTKASGIPGGEAVKQQLAAELGVKLVTIARPVVAYPHQTSDLAIALAFCQQRLGTT